MDRAYDSEGEVRRGGLVAELTGLLDLTGWPPGMRVIVRKERPHPGAQLRITDVNGWRVTAFATNTPAGGPGQSAARPGAAAPARARVEDRIRCMKDAGLRNLPLHGFDANRIWLAVVALAADLTAWMQTLALHDHPARRWEPKRLRLRIFSLAGVLAAHRPRRDRAPVRPQPLDRPRRPGPDPTPRDHRRHHDRVNANPAPTRQQRTTTVVEADDPDRHRRPTHALSDPRGNIHPKPAPQPPIKPHTTRSRKIEASPDVSPFRS